MKLAEVNTKINESDTRLADLNLLILRCSPKDMPPLLDEFSNLIMERQKFIFARDKMELEVTLSGSSLKELNLLINSLEERINLLRLISKRDDLPEAFFAVIFSQLDLFTKTKSQLLGSLQKLSWELEVNF